MSANIIDQINGHVEILKSNVKSSSTKLEIEARLGTVGPRGFNTDVGRPRFMMAMEALDRMTSNQKQIIEISSMGYGGTNFRYRKETNITTGEVNERLETKYSLFPIDDIDKWARYSFSIETQENNLPVSISIEPIERKITRTRYHIQKYWCYVDLSREELNNRIYYRIEIEMDLSVHKPERLIKHFLRCTREVTMMMLGTRIFYTFRELQYICFIVNTNVTGDFDPNEDPLFYTTKIKTQIMAQPWSLTMDDLQKGNIIGGKFIYDVCHKTDGVHFLFVITHNSIWLINSPFHYNLVSNESYGVVSPNETTILEVEVLNPFDHDRYIMHVIDSHVVQGENVRSCFRTERLRRGKLFIDQIYTRRNEIEITSYDTFRAVDASRNLGIEAKEFPKELFDIEFKSVSHFTTLGEMYNIIIKLLEEQKSGTLGYPTDGLIFTPVDSPYDFALRTDKDSYIKPKIYKWKPPHQVTIDFQIGLTEESKPYLLVANRDLDRTSIPFPGTLSRPFNYLTMISDIPRDMVGGIGEFSWNPEIEKFIFVRSRENKSSPNAIEVALDNWNLVRKPLTEETVTGRGMGQLRYLHNQVNREVLSVGNGILLDLGSGMGGTVNKWNNYNLVFAVEPVKEHIDELRIRARNLGFLERNVGESVNINEKIIVIIQGYAQETQKIRQAITITLNPEGDPNVSVNVDTVSMIDVGTFFWESPDLLGSVCDTINQCLKPGGRLLWKMMDGDAVRCAMGKFYEPLLESDTLKYSDDFVIEATGIGDQVKFAFKGGIAAKQTEYLTRISDFYLLLGKQYKIIYQRRADNSDGKAIITGDSLKASSLYIYGVMERIIPEGYVEKSRAITAIAQPEEVPKPIKALVTPKRQPVRSFTPTAGRVRKGAMFFGK